MEIQFSSFLQSLSEDELSSAIDFFLKQLSDATFQLLSSSVDSEKARRNKKRDSITDANLDPERNAKKMKSSFPSPTSDLSAPDSLPTDAVGVFHFASGKKVQIKDQFVEKVAKIFTDVTDGTIED